MPPASFRERSKYTTRKTADREDLLPSGRIYKFFKCANRKGEPRFSRNSSQCSSGMDIKTSTTLGSNCVPEQRLISPLACESGKDRKSTRLNSSHLVISYAVFCL